MRPLQTKNNTLLKIDGRVFGFPSEPPEPVPSSLVLLSNAQAVNGSTTFVDSSDAGNVITANGNAMHYANPYGDVRGVLDLDEGYITFPDSTDWDIGTSSMCIESWVYLKNTTQSQAELFAHVSADGRDTNEITLMVSTNALRVAVFLNASAVVFESFPVTYTANQWDHIAVTWDGSNVRCFHNGIQVGGDRAFSGTFPNITADVDIGRTHFQSSTYWLKGKLTNFRVSKGNARYTTNFVPPSEPLTTDGSTILLLNFDDLDGATTTTDESASGHVATFAGEARVFAGPYSVEGNRLGAMGDFSSGYLLSPNDPEWDLKFNATPPKSFALSARFKLKPTASLTGTHGLVSCCASTSDGWEFNYNWNTIVFWNRTNGKPMISMVPVVNTWYHILISYKVGDAFPKYWLDGLYRGGFGGVPNDYGGDGNQLVIGALTSAGLSPIDGYITDVALWQDTARENSDNFWVPSVPLTAESDLKEWPTKAWWE